MCAVISFAKICKAEIARAPEHARLGAQVRVRASGRCSTTPCRSSTNLLLKMKAASAAQGSLALMCPGGTRPTPPGPGRTPDAEQHCGRTIAGRSNLREKHDQSMRQ